jgi:hypothetical protein
MTSQNSIFPGIPVVHELEENLKPITHYYLGNQERAKKLPD